jgi:hypothetical protein
MDPNKDAYGQEIWAFFQGKESYEVVERDDGLLGLLRMMEHIYGYCKGQIKTGKIQRFIRLRFWMIRWLGKRVSFFEYLTAI